MTSASSCLRKSAEEGRTPIPPTTPHPPNPHPPPIDPDVLLLSWQTPSVGHLSIFTPPADPYPLPPPPSPLLPARTTTSPTHTQRHGPCHIAAAPPQPRRRAPASPILKVTHHLLALTVWSTHNPHNLSCRWLPPTPVATMTTHHLSRHLHRASALCRAVFILFTRRLA